MNKEYYYEGRCVLAYDSSFWDNVDSSIGEQLYKIACQIIDVAFKKYGKEKEKDLINRLWVGNERLKMLSDSIEQDLDANPKYDGPEGIILKDDKLKEIMHKKLSPIEYEKWISLKAEENDVCDEFFVEFNEKAEYAWGVNNGRKQSI